LLFAIFGSNVARIVIEYTKYAVFVFKSDGYWIIYDLLKPWEFVACWAPPINQETYSQLRSIMITLWPQNIASVPILHSRRGVARCASGNLLYISGGEITTMDNQTTPHFRAIGLCASKTEYTHIHFPPMRVARHSHAMVAFGTNEIYVIGGRNSFGEVLSTECFNTQEKTWKKCAPLDFCVVEPTVVVYNMLIYVFNGIFLHIYDPAANSWKTNSERVLIDASCFISSGTTAVVFDNKFLFFKVFFGSNSALPKRCNMYDPKTGTWSTFDDEILHDVTERLFAVVI
jgi:hypothetical protein